VLLIFDKNNKRMKKINLTILILLTSLFANAQSTIIRGVSLTIAHHDEELNDFVWGETQFLDFKLEMYKDTVTIYYPYQTTQIITGEYQKIDDESEGWKSIDDRGNTCFLYLLDLDEATWLKLEYFDRAYILQIQ
jgi:hypothetical protein